MSLDVRDKLKKTTKGKLVYAKEKLPINVPSPSPAGIFGIHDIPVMLETLEEKAFNDEDELLLSSKSSSSSSQSKITTTQPPPVEFSNDDASIAFFDLNDKKISQNLIELQVGKYRDSVLEAHRESQRKFQETQERRKNLKMKENLLWTSYQQSEKGAEEKIRREFEQQHQQRSSLLKTRILEAEKRKVEQNKHRIQETENIVTVTTKLHSLILQLVENMRSLVSSDTHIVTLVTNCVQKYSSIMSAFEPAKQTGNLDKHSAVVITEECDVHKSLCENLKVQLANLKEKEITRIREQEERIEREKEEKREKEKKEKERIKASLDEDPESQFPALPKELQLSVSRAAYSKHKAVMKIYQDFDEKSKQFTSTKDKQLNKVIFGISNVIGACVSSITSRSGSDVKNKLSDLNGLLEGRTVKSGGATANMGNHPGASNHAVLLIARKFVKQAESQVSSNHSTAFGLALTILGVWTKHDDFGNVFLALMHTRCPFLIPFYVPKQDNQSDDEYSKARGYKVSDGVVEVQDHYLSRMSGLVRTYAAVIQSPLPPGVRIHSHGIAEGWKWLTRMLNLEPWPEVTATILYDFLDVAGHALTTAYGRQFEKLLFSLCHDYLPKIEEISGSTGGPVLRLKTFLKECIQQKKVPKPEGHLGSDFWNTHHHTGIVGN